MDYLKKLLFPNINQITTQPDLANENLRLEISEEDIDNFLYQTSEISIQEIVTSDSIDSISSLFKHLDELEQIRREPSDEPLLIGSIETPEKSDEFVKEQVEVDSRKNIEGTDVELSKTVSEMININEEIKTPHPNDLAKAQLNKEPPIVNTIREINPEDLYNVLKESTVEQVRSETKNPANNLSEIEQIDVTTEEINDPANETTSAPSNSDYLSGVYTKLETTDEEETAMKSKPICDVLQMAVDLIKENSIQMPCKKPKHINLGIEEFNINTIDDVDDENIIKDSNEKCTRKATNETIIKNPIDAKDVVDLTQSDDETEYHNDTTEDSISEATRSHGTNASLSKDQTNDLKRSEVSTPTHSKVKRVEKNTTALELDQAFPNAMNTSKPNADNNIETIAKLLRQYRHSKPIKNPISHTVTAKDDTAPKDDVNEIIISISSTTDDDVDTNKSTTEIKEPDTVSCTEIEFKDEVTNELDSKTGTDNASTSEHNVEKTEPVDENYDSDHCSGYHSSDFEFITESEAEMAGFIINYNPERNKQRITARKRKGSTVRTIEIAKENYTTNNSKAPIGPRHLVDGRNENHMPAPSNIVASRPRSPVILEGEAYYNLFRQYDLNLIRYMENKSVFRRVNNSSMHVEYDALGHNMNLMMQRQLDEAVDDELKKEATETAKKIRDLYPRDNRKRYRRI